MYQFFDKRGYPVSVVQAVPNKLIDGQHYERLRRKTLTAFHLLLHFILTTTHPHLFHSNVTKT